MNYPVPAQPTQLSRASPQQIQRINRFASGELRDNELFPLGLEALRSHLWVLGAPGVGKTAAIANALIWPLFFLGFPCIIMDPVGALSRWLTWHICHYPLYIQPYLFDRLPYIVRGAKDYVVPTPLYAAKDENESHYTTASRLIDVIIRIDPHLVTASVEGMNSLRSAASYTGQLAAALGLQITDVADMLNHPHRWLARIAPVAKEHPYLRPALDYVIQLKEASPSIRARKTGSFMNHLLPFLSEPIMQATYATGGPGLQLDRHVQQGDTVIFDYSPIKDREHKQFAMLWDFLNIYEWAKGRGIEGRQTPCLLCIDEVSAMTNLHAMEFSILGDDITELSTQYARNIGMQLCFINQTVSQLPPSIVTALSQFGTKCILNIPNLDDALYLARLVYDYDPYRLKKETPVYFNDPIPEFLHTGPRSVSIFARANPTVIDYTTEEFSIDEQYLMAAQVLQKLRKFEAVVKAASGEGDLTAPARRTSFEHLINGHFPVDDVVSEALEGQRKKWGIPVDQVQKEKEKRQQQTVQVKQAGQVNKRRRRNRKKKERDKQDPGQKKAGSPSSDADHEQEEHGHLPAHQKDEPKAEASDNAQWKLALWEFTKGDARVVHQG